MVTMKWSPWSDLHRRIRVYETRPVAAEAQGRSEMSSDEIRMTNETVHDGCRPDSSFDIRHSTFELHHLEWCSHVDLHHEPPPSQSGVQNWLHLESVVS